MSVLKQIFKLIPRNLIPKLSHALGLNDICDTLRNHKGVLTTTPPSRNGFSHANRNRNADMAENLFWSVLGHLKSISPGFYSQGRNYCAMPRKFKRVINVIDSSAIQLVANCMDWAKHRRRKAAAKMHLRLDLRSFLPSFVVTKLWKIIQQKIVFSQSL